MKSSFLIIFAAFVLSGCRSLDPIVVGEQYCIAIEEGDFSAFCSLFPKDHPIHDETNRFAAFNAASHSLEVVSVSNPYINIHGKLYGAVVDGDFTLTIYLNDNGTIKYDFVSSMGHPTRWVIMDYSELTSKNKESREFAAHNLSTYYKIPLFGYDANSSTEGNKLAVTKIREWIVKNRSDLNITRGDIPMSETDFNYWMTISE